MKSIYSLLLLSSLAFMFSCNSNESNDPAIDSGEPATMTINLTSDSNSTKAAGTPVTTDESKIGRGVVFVFKGNVANPSLDGRAVFDYTAGAHPITVNVTAGLFRHVYIVANADTAAFNGVLYRNDLYNLTTKASLVSLRSGTNLPMSGFQDNIAVDKATPTTLSLPLRYIASRVSMDWTVDAAAPAGLSVVDAYLLNVRNYSDYFGVPQATTPVTYSGLTANTNSYLYGADITGFTGGDDPTTSMLPYAPPVEYNTLDVALGMNGDLSQKGFGNNYFYIFENTDFVSHTLVVIKATQGTDKYYYPIIINGDNVTTGGNQSNNVSRSKIYNVNAIIKGFGSSDPYSPVNRSAMDITVSAADWDPVIAMTQEFN